MKYKDNILLIAVIVLLSYIIFDNWFKPKPQQIINNKYEVIQKQYINEDSLHTVWFKQIDLKLDSLKQIQQSKLIEYEKQDKKLQSKYKILRISPDSLPNFN